MIYIFYKLHFQVPLLDFYETHTNITTILDQRRVIICTGHILVFPITLSIIMHAHLYWLVRSRYDLCFAQLQYGMLSCFCGFFRVKP